MFDYAATLAWWPDRGFVCFGPTGLSTKMSVSVWWHGLGRSLLAALYIYLVPFCTILFLAAGSYWFATRRFFFRIADSCLLAIPAVIWLGLVAAFPLARNPLNFLETAILGGTAALTIVARIPFSRDIWSEQSKAGALGVSCLAICFWAFMPEFKGLL